MIPTEIESIVLELVRESQHHLNTDILKDNNARIVVENWKQIKRELEQQAIIGFPIEIINLIELSDFDKNSYRMEIATILKKYYQVLIEQSKLINLLNKYNIEFVVLKGTAAAVYYDQPEYRQMGDIDIIVAPDQIEIVDKILLSNEYSKVRDIGKHITYKSVFGQEIELHREFLTNRKPYENAYLNQLIIDALPRKEKCSLLGESFFMLPKLENGLVLLTHINQHLSSGLGLRQIIDWMMYVKCNLDDNYWNDSFYKQAKAIGLDILAKTVTLMCKRHLGLIGITWCDSADVQISDKLLNYIMEKGNFGTKMETKKNSILTVLHEFRNPIATMHYLTAAGVYNWNLAKKYTLLKPFAWIYQLYHLFKRGISKGDTIGNMCSYIKKSADDVELLKQLGVI